LDYGHFENAIYAFTPEAGRSILMLKSSPGHNKKMMDGHSMQIWLKND